MSAGELVDTHLHLEDGRFHPDREAVLRRAREAGVTGVVTCGSDVASSREAVALAERFGDGRAERAAVWAAVGIHPHEAGRVGDVEAALAELAALAAHPRVVAIGETGLDYHYAFSPREVQREVFRRQLRLAAALDKPVIVHAREAEEDVLAILEELRPPAAGVLHAFAGSLHQARRAVAMGWYLGVGGILTFPRADRVREVATALPLERLLLETDAPYLAPVPHRGQRNEPAHVAVVARHLARLRGVPPEEVAALTTGAARRLLGLGAGRAAGA